MQPGDVAPLVAVITLSVAATLVLVLRGPLGRAIADRIVGRRGAGDGEVGQLRAEVEALRGEMVGVQERLDFAERMLTRERERDQLPRGAGG